jgi:hypothetical protein
MVCSNSGELQKKNASVTLQGRSNHTLGQNETANKTTRNWKGGEQ